MYAYGIHDPVDVGGLRVRALRGTTTPFFHSSTSQLAGPSHHIPSPPGLLQDQTDSARELFAFRTFHGKYLRFQNPPGSPRGSGGLSGPHTEEAYSFGGGGGER